VDYRVTSHMSEGTSDTLIFCDLQSRGVRRLRWYGGWLIGRSGGY
jgi:hypothetical protein